MARRNEAAVDIAAPAADIFRWIAESHRRVRWIQGLESSTETTDTGFTVGTGFLEVLVLEGRRYELDVVITEVDAPRLLGQAIVARGGFTSKATWRLIERDGETAVRFEQETTYHHLLARVLGGVITRAAQNKITADLERLKTLAELH